MRILFMTQVLPFPLDAGPKIRAYYVMRYLAEAGHEIDLLSFVRPGEPGEHLGSLRRTCRSVETVPLVRSRLRDLRDGARSLVTDTPFLVLRDQVSGMRDRLECMLASRSFDALHADQLWMAPYGIERPGPGLTVLDQHNAVFLVPQRLAEHRRNPLARALLRLEATKLHAYEREACRRFDRVVWVTDEDQRAVGPTAGRAPSTDWVIPIATDPDVQQRVARTRPFRVTFLGGLHWPPNREGADWLVDRLWPAVANAAPSMVLTLIGKGSPKWLRRLKSVPRVEVTGYVSDLRQYVSETAVFVVPLRSGAGMRVKILDAWCWGVPIVSTTVGAEGLKVATGENLLIADDEGAFAEAIIRVIRNPGLGERLAQGGRSTVEAHYNWKRVYGTWSQVYQT